MRAEEQSIIVRSLNRNEYTRMYIYLVYSSQFLFRTFANRSRRSACIDFLKGITKLTERTDRFTSVIAASGKISGLSNPRPTHKLLKKKIFSSANEMKGQSFHWYNSGLYRSSGFCHSQCVAYMTLGCNNRATTCVKSAWHFRMHAAKPKGRLAKARWWSERVVGGGGRQPAHIVPL